MTQAVDEWGQPWRPHQPHTGWQALKEALREEEHAVVPLTGSGWEIIEVIDELEALLVEKNRAYGDSFSQPINVFSDLDSREQILVRIDDKLNRIQKGSEFQGDDTVIDLIGYLILLRVLDKRQERT